MNSILLISPQFYNYYQDIKDELEKRGKTVTWFSDSFPSTNLSYIRKKLNKKYFENHMDKYVEEIISKVSEKNFDTIILIFAVYFQSKHIEMLREACKSAKIIYYAWDSVDSFPNIEKIAKACDISYSFDNEDCEKYNMRFLPLYYKPYKIQENETNIDYFSFMNFDPKKANNYKKIKKVLPENLKGIEHLRIKSKLFYRYFKMFYRNEFKSFHKKDFKFYNLSKEEVDKNILLSKAIIDCPLESQRGLTMRTFEVLSKRKKLITTNKNIKLYPFYSPNNIFVVEDEKSIPSSFFSTPFDEKYTLSDLFSIRQFVTTLTEDNYVKYI